MSIGAIRFDAINERAQATAREVAVRRAVGIAKRPRRRIPKQIQPRAIEREYARELLKIVAQVKGALGPLLDELPQLLENAANERRADSAMDRFDFVEKRGSKWVVLSKDGKVLGTHDTEREAVIQLRAIEASKHRADVGEARRVSQLIDLASTQMSEAVAPSAVDSLLTKFRTRTADHNSRELSRQVRAALGIDVIASDAGLGPLVEGFAAENAALIKDIPAKIIGEVERASTRAISSGTLHRDLAKEIEKRIGFARDRARLIARDQVGKLYGQINAKRQQNLGVTHFFWRDSNDDRVRDEHEAIDGQRFSYAEGGAPGEGLPGEPILCRCNADPDFSTILEAV